MRSRKGSRRLTSCLNNGDKQRENFFKLSSPENALESFAGAFRSSCLTFLLTSRFSVFRIWISKSSTPHEPPFILMAQRLADEKSPKLEVEKLHVLIRSPFLLNRSIIPIMLQLMVNCRHPKRDIRASRSNETDDFSVDCASRKIKVTRLIPRCYRI